MSWFQEYKALIGVVAFITFMLLLGVYLIWMGVSIEPPFDPATVNMADASRSPFVVTRVLLILGGMVSIIIGIGTIIMIVGIMICGPPEYPTV